MLDSYLLINNFHRNDKQSDPTYPHTSILDKMQRKSRNSINEGAAVWYVVDHCRFVPSSYCSRG